MLNTRCLRTCRGRHPSCRPSHSPALRRLWGTRGGRRSAAPHLLRARGSINPRANSNECHIIVLRRRPPFSPDLGRREGLQGRQRRPQSPVPHTCLRLRWGGLRLGSFLSHRACCCGGVVDVIVCFVVSCVVCVACIVCCVVRTNRTLYASSVLVVVYHLAINKITVCHFVIVYDLAMNEITRGSSM